MSNRRTGALAAVLISLAATGLLAGCGHTPTPQASQSPAAPSTTTPSGSPTSAALEFGQSATVGGFQMTPTAIRDRPGPVYDTKGASLDGQGIKIAIKVSKDHEADLQAGELTVPVARVVDADGQAVEMDDFFGMTPADAQSDEYSLLYARSYQYACVQPAGSASTGALWFSLPKGFAPTTLVIDGGAAQEAAWLLP